uniref:Reverse transcriptase domain-containing protein n=1 Tax=Haemonchus contortus TaxID=6289 RepID=A0A7I4YT02_HAECO
MGVKVNGRYLDRLCFVDDIVLITPNIEQAEQMLAEFGNACGKIGLRLNPKKTMLMRIELVPDASSMLSGTNISEGSRCVSTSRSQHDERMNDLAPELSGRKRAAWGAFTNIAGVVKKAMNIAHLSETAVLPALTYASVTWTLQKQDEHAVSIIQRAVGRMMLGIFPYTQRQNEIRVPRPIDERRSGMPLNTPKIENHMGRDLMRYSDDRWTRAITDWIPSDVKRTPGRPPAL